MGHTDEIGAVVRELAPSGQLRFALNHGNVVLVRRAPDGTPTGVSVDLARELSRRLGVEPNFVHYERAGDVSGSVAQDVWDVCFLAIDPLRAREISFTDPYVAIEGNFLVPASSPAASPADVNRLGLRVAVTKGSAYALHLLREAGGAAIVEFETSEQAGAALLNRSVDALAGVRQAVELFARAHRGFRLISDPFMSIRQAMGIKAGRPRAEAYVKAFVAEAKASGFVADALARSGHTDVRVP